MPSSPADSTPAQAPTLDAARDAEIVLGLDRLGSTIVRFDMDAVRRAIEAKRQRLIALGWSGSLCDTPEKVANIIAAAQRELLEFYL